jgi:hypothetical protein
MLWSIFKVRSIFGLSLLLFSLENISATVLLTNVNTNRIAVGDRVHLTISAVIPKGSSISPAFKDSSLGANIILKGFNTRTVQNKNSDSVIFDYLLTTYVPENCTIPPLPFLAQAGQRIDTLKTQQVNLTLESLVSSDRADIKEIKPLQTAGKKPLWWLWILSFVALLSGIILAVKYFLSKSRKHISVPPPKPPYEEAIDALRELEAKKYLEKGLIKEYVFELSEIFKRYIARRFEINAEEFTTEEMICWVDGSVLGKKQRSSVEWFFRNTDPVKFARLIPDQQTLSRFLEEVKEFLESTKPILPEAGSKENAEVNSNDTVSDSEKETGSEKRISEKIKTGDRS